MMKVVNSFKNTHIIIILINLQHVYTEEYNNLILTTLEHILNKKIPEITKTKASEFSHLSADRQYSIMQIELRHKGLKAFMRIHTFNTACIIADNR